MVNLYSSDVDSTYMPFSRLSSTEGHKVSAALQKLIQVPAKYYKAFYGIPRNSLNQRSDLRGFEVKECRWIPLLGEIQAVGYLMALLILVCV